MEVHPLYARSLLASDQQDTCSEVFSVSFFQLRGQVSQETTKKLLVLGGHRLLEYLFVDPLIIYQHSALLVKRSRETADPKGVLMRSAQHFLLQFLLDFLRSVVGILGLS